MFFLDIAAVFPEHCCRFSRLLPFLFYAFVQKLLGICTKQNIFCTKSGENFSMFFQFFPDIFYPDLELFCFFP